MVNFLKPYGITKIVPRTVGLRFYTFWEFQKEIIFTTSKMLFFLSAHTVTVENWIAKSA
jgi:hypothetical protein